MNTLEQINKAINDMFSRLELSIDQESSKEVYYDTKALDMLCEIRDKLLRGVYREDKE